MARNTSESSSTLSKIGFAITSYISKPGAMFPRKMKEYWMPRAVIGRITRDLRQRLRCDCAASVAGSLCLRQRVLKFIGMFAVGGDLDDQLSGETCKLSGTGIRRHLDRELRRAASHETGVMQDKGTASALQRP